MYLLELSEMNHLKPRLANGIKWKLLHPLGTSDSSTALGEIKSAVQLLAGPIYLDLRGPNRS